MNNISSNEENENIQDFSNIEINKISNELNKRQLNNNRNLKNFKNLNNKKMFDNITFSINKYLNSNVNFQKHNNDQINNSYGKVKNKMTYKNLKIKNKENFNVPNDIRTHNSTSNISNEYINHKTNIDNVNNINSINNLIREINDDQVIENISNSSNYENINLLAQTFNYENVKILKTHLEGNINSANMMGKKRNNIYSNIEENKDNSNFFSYIEWLSEVSEITDEEKDIEDINNNNNRKNNNLRWSHHFNNSTFNNTNSEASHLSCSQINSKEFQNDQIVSDKMKGLYYQFGKYNYQNEQVEEFGQNENVTNTIDNKKFNENNKLPYFEENKNQGKLESDNISDPHLTIYSSEKKNDDFIEGEAEFDTYGMGEINSGNLIEAKNASSSNILKNPNNLNNIISSNLIQENEINKFPEPINHIPIEDLFITSWAIGP